jgi:dienelactone hydrolase
MLPFLLVLVFSCAAMAQNAAVEALLKKPLLDPKQPAVEVQVYTESRVPILPVPGTSREWEEYASRLRARVLDEVVLRGEAKQWAALPLKVEWLDTIEAGDYSIRKLRFESVPGMWTPGLLYQPARLSGKAPVVLNVNGHEKTGVSTAYIQQRCIHLARNGVLALNLEWWGRGQMTDPRLTHYALAQIDLTGTSGLAVFYLAMRRGLDLIETLPYADTSRIAVTGLSGGGWQTILISSLDTRVKLANPVAGYSSFVTRAQWPDLDLGDSEQTPSDLGAIADYTHLTALVAPRALQIANNAKDDCCFRAEYALGPLAQTGRTIYGLMGAPERFRYHVNFGAGHNYNEDNREAFYRMLRDFFYGGGDFPLREKPLDRPLRTAEELHIPMPAENGTFQSVATELARGLPRKGQATRERLRELVRAPEYRAEAVEAGSEEQGGVRARYWKLRMGGAWTVPAVELVPGNPAGTTMLLADGGRESAGAEAAALLARNRRVVALDPFYFGESKLGKRDFLYAILIASLGERPLGVQAGQVAAAARWLRERDGGRPVEVMAAGRRTGLVALAASALETGAIARHEVRGGFTSLKEILAEGITAEQAPELFCFGLLESFDIPQIEALSRQ